MLENTDGAMKTGQSRETSYSQYKYSSPSILRYIFHIKPHFPKMLL